MEHKSIINELLSSVRTQNALMKMSMENDKVMDALKHCSNILNQLRTSSLSPKDYNSLYFTVFDSLQILAPYLKELHLSGKQNLADLYELVQYAGSVITRLYLMITVGSAYISLATPSNSDQSETPTNEEIPVREVLFDMLEMTRGVQHPIRGLFLRYYLGQMTKDHLPSGTIEGPAGNIDDSIHFLLANFTEMNKLWVRMQHQGLTRDRAKREEERRDLRTLVGSNLLRLSLLEGVTLSKYHDIILPSMLSQVVSCKDPLAQEYLMEATVQAFSDECHLNTLGMLTTTLGKLHPKVLIRSIITSLADRVTLYYSQKKAESKAAESNNNSNSNQDPSNNIWPKKDLEPSSESQVPHPDQPDTEKISKAAGNITDSATDLDGCNPTSDKNSISPATNGNSDQSKNKLETPETAVSGYDNDKTNSQPPCASNSDLNTDKNKLPETQSIPDNPQPNTESSVNNESDKKLLESTEALNTFKAQDTANNDTVISTIETPPPRETAVSGNSSLNESRVSNSNFEDEKNQGGSQDIPENTKVSSKSTEVDEDLLRQFWTHVHKLLQVRNDLSLSDVILVCNSMLKMVLTIIPESVDFANTILEFTTLQVDTKEHTTTDSPNLVAKNILMLLITPLRAYSNQLDVLTLDKYSSLLQTQSIKTKKNLSIAFITLLLQREIIISDTKTASKVLKLCVYPSSLESKMKYLESSNELGLLSRLVHLFQSQDPVEYFRLLEVFSNSLSVNPQAMIYILPAIISDSAHLITKISRSGSISAPNSDNTWVKLVIDVLRFVKLSMEQLVNLSEGDNKLMTTCLNLYLLVGQTLSIDKAFNENKVIEDASLEFFIEAMSAYESIMTDSQSQHLLLMRLTGALYTSTNFNIENYTILAQRCILNANRLLKRQDKCRATLACANLWWRTLTDYELWESDNKAKRLNYESTNNSSNVYELLQKSIQLAEPSLDTNLVSLLYAEIYDSHLMLFENGCPSVTPRSINDLSLHIIALFEKNKPQGNEDSDEQEVLSKLNTLPFNSILTSADSPNGNIIPSRLFYRIMNYLDLKKESVNNRDYSYRDDINSKNDFLNNDNSDNQKQIDYSAIKTRF